MAGRRGAEKPLLILTSERVPREYLSYLDGRNISWIAAGKERIDLARAAEILGAEFGVERMAVVGGSAINTSFLDAGLLDEVSILVGAGIDGRGGMPAVFDGLAYGPSDDPPASDRCPEVRQRRRVASIFDSAVGSPNSEHAALTISS